MWLSEKLKEEAGKVLSSHTVLKGGQKPILSGKGKVDVVAPYGICSSLPAGMNVYSADDMALGVSHIPHNIPELKEGEVCLYSKGGYILIKNSGEIIINGKTLNI